jgi:hypothetical protein
MPVRRGHPQRLLGARPVRVLLSGAMEDAMKGHALSVEPARILGILGEDGVLYCSWSCADTCGQGRGRPVDADQYDALTNRRRRDDALCPACGGEYGESRAGDVEQ